MNRKLHTSLMALSSTGLLLVVGLLVATPQTPPAPFAAAQPAAREAAAAAREGREARAEAQARAMQARAEAFELQVAAAADTGEAIGATAAFVAEMALAAALQEAREDARPARTAHATAEPGRGGTRGNARRALALPYFSFARGGRG